MKLMNYADLVLSPCGWRASGLVNGKIKVTLPIKRIRCSARGVEIVTANDTYELAKGTRMFSDGKLELVVDWYKEKGEYEDVLSSDC